MPVIAKSSHAFVKCWSRLSRCSRRRSKLSGCTARPALKTASPYFVCRDCAMSSPCRCLTRMLPRFSHIIEAHPAYGGLMAGRLEGSVAIVTAGGQGIGDTISQLFAREGASVAVVDMNKTEAERVAGVITAAGGKAFAYIADVSRTETVN